MQPESWDVYTCAMDGRLATVVFRDGLEPRLEAAGLVAVAIVSLRMTHPTAKGMPGEVEIAALEALEDDLQRTAEQAGGIYVGRTTTNGERDFFIYTSASAADVAAQCGGLSDRHGYPLVSLVQPDPARAVYRDHICPSPVSRQQMNDMRVIDALRREGDRLDKPRQIAHWAYFEAAADAARFAAAVSAQGFYIDQCAPPPGRTAITVAFSRIDCPDPSAFIATTTALWRLAGACGGTYDGWETSVETDND